MRALNVLFPLMMTLMVGCDALTAEEHLGRAREYAAEQEYPAAVIELKNALQKEPDHAAARLELGSLYMRTGDYPSAVKELERALDLGVDPDIVRPQLLQAKLHVGRFHEVLGELEDESDLSPALMSIKGQALLNGDDRDTAKALLESAVEQDPTLAEAYIALAKIAVDNGDIPLAERLLTRGVESGSDSQRLWLAKADIEVRLDQLDDARAAYSRATELPGRTVAPVLGLARISLLEGDLEAASNLVDEVKQRFPRDRDVNYFLGLIAFNNDDLEGAEQALLQALSRAPNHLPSLLLIGTVNLRQGDHATAESHLGRYVARAPTDLSGRRMLAATRLSAGDSAGAVEALEPLGASLVLAGDLALLGSAHLQIGNYEEATRYLSQAAEMEPGEPDFRTNLALSLLGSGDDDAAIRELETAITLDRDLVRNEVLLIEARLRSGDIQGAGKAAEAFVDREPENPAAVNLLGLTQLAAGNQDAAKASFHRAIDLNPAFSPAVENLARLTLAGGDEQEAARLYSALLEADDDSLVAVLGLARIASSTGDHDSAWRYLERGRSTHPSALQPRIGLGRLALAQQRPAAAQDAVREAVALSPDSASVRLMAAQFEVALGRTAEAIPHVDRLEQLNDHPRVDPVALLAQADVQRRLGRYAGARRSLDKVLRRQPESVPALAELLKVEIAARDPVRARAAWERLADLDEAQATALRGDVLTIEGKDQEAVAAYTDRFGQGDTSIVGPLAMAHFRASGIEKAREFMEGWLADHPEDLVNLQRLAALELTHGDRDRAFRHYQRLNEVVPDQPIVLNNLAVLYAERDDPRSVDLARRSHALDSTVPEVADTLGWTLVRFTESYGEAVRLLESAVRRRPENPTIQYHLAVAYERAGDVAKSLTAVQAALERGEFPERADAQALAERLRLSVAQGLGT